MYAVYPYFELARNRAPYLENTKGTGIMAIAIKPKVEQAHPGPKLMNIWVTNNGNAAAMRYRKKLFADMAEATCVGGNAIAK